MSKALDGLFGIKRLFLNGEEKQLQPAVEFLGDGGEVSEREETDEKGTFKITSITLPTGSSGSTPTLADYTQPASNANVSVQALTAGLAEGQTVFVEGGGTYQVVTITDASHVLLKNLGYASNADPGETVSTGARIVASGLEGEAGSNGAPGPAGVVGNAQPSLKIFTLAGVENIQIQTHIHLTDYPYNARASAATSTASTTAGSPTVTLAAAGDWANRDGIFIPEAGDATTLITPAAPTADVRGTTGATTRTYKIVGMTAAFALTAASAGLAVTNTNATLSETNYLEISAPVTPMVDGYTRVNASVGAFVVAQSNRTYIAGETVWLAAQTAPGENGPYVVGTVTSGTAPLTRATWCDSAAEATALSGYFVQVRPSRGYGSGFAGTPRMLQVTSGTITTLGADPITTSEEVEQILVYVDDARAPGSFRLIGAMATRADFFSGTVAPHFHMYDIGQAVLSPSDLFIPGTAPTSAVKGCLIARIIAGAGTTTLTLDRNAGSTVASKIARHDNSLALQEAHDSCSAQGSDAGRRIVIPENIAQYRFHRTIEIDKQVTIEGTGQDSTWLEWCTGIGFMRLRGQTTSRYGSQAFGAKLIGLKWSQSSRALPAGGDTVSKPYLGQLAAYSATTHLYEGGNFTDFRKLSWISGAAVLVTVQATIERCRGTLIRGTPLVFSGTSDDTGSNCNNAEIRGFIANQITAGHGVHVTGYDASNCRFYDIRTTGAADGAGMWDDSFTGAHWYSFHSESCYLAGAFTSATSKGELFGPYFESGMLAFRGGGECVAFGGTYGTGITGGMIAYTGGGFTAGIGYSIDTYPTRTIRTFGSAGGGYLEQIQTDDTAFSAAPIRTNFSASLKEFQCYLADVSNQVWSIAATSVKIFGGMMFPRGLLLGTSAARRALRIENGAPGTGTNRIYEPGDLIYDYNTGRQIRVKAKCVSSATAWAATTANKVGNIIVPTSNNTLNRGFVSQSNASTGGSQPNWDAVADNGTVADGGVTWQCWGATGSGSPQFDLPLEVTTGADLGDTSPTLQIGNGARYCRRAGVQTANRTVTLGVTGVEDGDTIVIECEAHATYTLAIADGGSGGGTLYTVPAARSEAPVFRYDGATTQWKFSGKTRVS